MAIKIHVMHTGKVCVSPYLPFGGENCNILKASGLIVPKSKWLWLPVSVYLIEHPKGLILVDTGWGRDMSPDGVFDKKAQIRALGSRILYNVNQGVVEKGAAVHEQLAARGIKTSELDYVLMTHLDCDHACGLQHVRDARSIMVAEEEIAFAHKNRFVRYQKKWWDGINFDYVKWNGKEGPVGKSCDLFGDGSITLVNIPGHADGLFAIKVKNAEGKSALLFADGGYATKSWQKMILPGISSDKAMQRQSLEWIREQSLSPQCITSIATHDTDVKPHIIEV